LIRKKVREVADDPAAARNVKKLTGRDGYRLRVGDWRVVYELDDGVLVLIVIDIGPRGGIYD
jgi:mRNA interferase RelE/StbE